MGSTGQQPDESSRQPLVRRRMHTYLLTGGDHGPPPLEERLHLSAITSIKPDERRSIHSYPMAQRSNPAPGHELIPMTSKQRAAYMAWYADSRNLNRIALRQFLQKEMPELQFENAAFPRRLRPAAELVLESARSLTLRRRFEWWLLVMSTYLPPRLRR